MNVSGSDTHELYIILYDEHGDAYDVTAIVSYCVSGSYRPATRIDPAEFREVEIEDIVLQSTRLTRGKNDYFFNDREIIVTWDEPVYYGQLESFARENIEVYIDELGEDYYYDQKVTAMRGAWRRLNNIQKGVI